MHFIAQMCIRDSIYSLVVSLIAMIPMFPIMSWLSERDKKNGIIYDLSDVEDVQAEDASRKLPSIGKSLMMLAIPILLLVVGSFGKLAVTKDATIYFVFSFIGNKNVAMLIGVLCAMLLALPYLQKNCSEIMDHAAAKVGGILLITGGGGAYAAVLKATGIADKLADLMAGLPISLFILCFLTAQIIRAAQGSATVCLSTTAAILSPTIAASGLSPILLSLIHICGRPSPRPKRWYRSSGRSSGKPSVSVPFSTTPTKACWKLTAVGGWSPSIRRPRPCWASGGSICTSPLNKV